MLKFFIVEFFFLDGCKIMIKSMVSKCFQAG